MQTYLSIEYNEIFRQCRLALIDVCCDSDQSNLGGWQGDALFLDSAVRR